MLIHVEFWDFNTSKSTSSMNPFHDLLLRPAPPKKKKKWLPGSHPIRTWELEFYSMAKTVMLQRKGSEISDIMWLSYEVNRICFEVVEVWYHKRWMKMSGEVQWTSFISWSIGDVPKKPSNTCHIHSLFPLFLFPPCSCFFFGFQGVGSKPTLLLHDVWASGASGIEFSNLWQGRSKNGPYFLHQVAIAKPWNHVFYLYLLQK